MTATQTAQTNFQPAVQNAFATRDQLVMDHMDLVKAIAGQVRRGLAVHVEMDDLQHAGMMGLIDAASKYAQNKDVPFHVYAKHRVRGAVLDSLRQADWATRQARRNYKRVEAVTRDLSAKLQRVPTQQEIAEAMGLDPQRWQSMMAEYRSLSQSARQNNSDTEDRPAKEIPTSSDASPESMFARSEIRQRISSALSSLPDRYRQVVSLYYEGDLTMKEIGTRLGVKESRVSQIHKTALAKIQIILTSNGISDTAALC